MDTTTMPVMLTMHEAAEKFKLPYNFVRNMVLDKKVKIVRSGKKIFINESSLIELLNNGEE